MLPTRGDGLLTTAQAAAIAGAKAATIRSWVARDHLRPAGLAENGRPLYRREDVIAAERTVRDNGLRRSRTDPRAVRRRNQMTEAGRAA